jgi:signal transduction histidine kinase
MGSDLAIDRPDAGSMRRRAWAAASGMAGTALLAGAQLASPRILVACALAGLLCAGLLWHSLAALGRRVQAPGREWGALRPDQEALLAQALAIEVRLEHAPVAVLRIDTGKLTPCNVNARRLLAPGRVADAVALHAQLDALPAGARKLVSYDTERGNERALAAVSAVLLHGATERIAVLMPVESELEAEALQAWRQLVQVLTHEIMNSLTPVASLSHTAREMLDEIQPSLPQAATADLSTALEAIARRADSLVGFVGSYRSLSGVPEPQPQLLALADLFARLDALVRPAWEARGGKVAFEVQPASLELMVDGGQLEQAIINLLKNAAEATETNAAPSVQVSARLARGGRLRIEVADNGPGVPPELVASIFTPFFSTRKQGNGIGLAMVRHLVHANGGTVRYARGATEGARFVITF